MMPLLLGLAGNFLGCEAESTLFLVLVGFVLLFLECLWLIAYSRVKQVRSNALMVLCYLGMVPLGLFLFLIVLSMAYSGG